MLTGAMMLGAGEGLAVAFFYDPIPFFVSYVDLPAVWKTRKYQWA